MPMDKREKKKIVEAALRAHLPYDGEGQDTRHLIDLRREFERRHLQPLVALYQKSLQVIEDIEIEDID
jgi:hypothetical protein